MMTERTLRDCRVLVVEDEYLLADELRTELEDAGAIVLGPVGTLEKALALVESEPIIHAVILDINLQGEMAFSVADLLIDRSVPFVFTTGYEESIIPSRYESIPRCEKPVDIKKVAQAIGRLIHA